MDKKSESFVFFPNAFRMFFLYMLTLFLTVSLMYAFYSLFIQKGFGSYFYILIGGTIGALIGSLMNRKRCRIEIKDGFVEGPWSLTYVRDKISIKDINWDKSFRSSGFRALFRSNYIYSNIGEKIYLNSFGFTNAQINSIKEALKAVV